MDLLSRVLRGKPDSLGRCWWRQPKPLVVALLPSFSVNPAFGVSLGVSDDAFTRLGTRGRPPTPARYQCRSTTPPRSSSTSWSARTFSATESASCSRGTGGTSTPHSRPTVSDPHYPRGQKDDIDFNLVRVYQTFYQPAHRAVCSGVSATTSTAYFNIRGPQCRAGAAIADARLQRRPDRSPRTPRRVCRWNLAFDSRDNPNYPTRGILQHHEPQGLPNVDGKRRQLAELSDGPSDLLNARPARPGACWPSGRATWFTFGGPRRTWSSRRSAGTPTRGAGRGYPRGRIRGRQPDLRGERVPHDTCPAMGFWGAGGLPEPALHERPRDHRGVAADRSGHKGAGLRIKLNKRSRTNITLDFGFGCRGIEGSLHGQHRGLLDRQSRPPWRSCRWKVAPPSALLSAQSRPPCAAMIERQIDRPRPSPRALVVKNGSNSRSHGVRRNARSPVGDRCQLHAIAGSRPSRS